MQQMLELKDYDFDKPTLAIVCFGPATPSTGLRPADYYQVTIDPNCCSPSGKYIRFGLYRGDEITGWQRVEAMTVVEILGDSDKTLPDDLTGYKKVDGATVTMMKLE